MSNEPGPGSRRSPVEDRPYRRYRADGPERGSRGDADRPYKVYRSAPRGLLSRLRGEDDLALEEERRGRDGGDGGRRAGPGQANPWWRRQLRPRRVLSYLAIAVVGWLLLSFALFMISAYDQAGNIPAAALAELTAGGNMLTSTDTILVLGTDQRPRTGPGSKEPGSDYNDAGSNSDTIMLWRLGGGVSRRLSIPRDTAYDIPGVGLAKINAAYSAGGPALALKTIEQFTGLRINHIIIVNLANFPKFIDAIGGITLTTDRVCSNISGGTANGGFTLDLTAGAHHLDGEQALILARTRENSCNPAENDLTREKRQQEILNAIKSQLLSPSTFLRLPWASWYAPQTLRTDMGGFTLLSLFAAAEIGGSAPTALLPTTPETLPDGGDALNVSAAAVRTAVAKLTNG